MIIGLYFLREKIPKKNDKSVFIEKISENFPFNFTNDQSDALDKIIEFLFAGSNDALFLLKGYAG